MPHYKIFEPDTPKIDEFSIYERRLTPDEINDHNRYCLIPDSNYGWDRTASTEVVSEWFKYRNINDVAAGVNGTLKGFNSANDGMKMFEVFVGKDDQNNDGGIIVPLFMPTTPEIFSVGVADINADQSSILYNEPGEELPCHENHILLWMNFDPSTNEVEAEISYALESEYGNIEVTFPEDNIESMEYNTFTVLCDFENKVITFLSNGAVVHEFDYSHIPQNIVFRPAVSSYNENNSNQLAYHINTYGDFEYGNVNYTEWGIGSVAPLPDVDDIESESLYDIILQDNPSLYFPCNEHYGEISNDIISNNILEHTSNDIVASYGIADGFCLSYMNDRYFDTKRASYCFMPSSHISSVEGALEFTFRRDTTKFYEAFNIFDIKPQNFNQDIYDDLPDNTWLMSLEGKVVNTSITGTPKYEMEFSMRFGSVSDSVYTYGIGSSTRPTIKFYVELIPDNIYHFVISIDERKRMWIYVNGAIVKRICGAEWCQVEDSEMMFSINDSLGISSDYNSSYNHLYDNIAFYKKHLNLLDVQKRYVSISESLANYKEHNIQFLKLNDRYSTTTDKMYFLPNENVTKVVEYDTEWTMNYRGNDLPITAVSSSKTHTVFLHNDGTVSGEGSNSNNEINLSGYSNVIKAEAGNGFTVLLLSDGTINVQIGVSDPWNNGNVPIFEDKIVDVVSGGDHIVALDNTGRVYAWGRNDLGQCTAPENLTLVSQVAAGETFTYALQRNGIVRAWGSDIHGELDIAVDTNKRFVNIQANGYIGAGIDTENNLSVVGDINLSNIDLSPMNVITYLGLGNDSIIVGEQHKHYKVDGKLYFSVDTEVNINDFIDEKFAYATQYDYSEYVKDVISAYQYVFALRSDGKLYGWGNNSSFYGYPLNIPSTVQDTKKVSAYYHVIALEEDGTVICWGRNNVGQCNVPSWLENIVEVISIGNTSIAIDSSGNVFYWGELLTWLPSNIGTDVRKVLINLQTETMIVLYNSGNVSEYNDTGEYSEFNGLSEIVDIAMTRNIAGTEFENFGMALKRDGTVLYLNTYESATETFILPTLFNKNIVELTGGEDIGILDRKGRAYNWTQQFEDYIREDVNAIQLSSGNVDTSNVFTIDSNSLIDIWYSVGYVQNPPDVTFIPDLSFNPDSVSWDFLIDTESGGANSGRKALSLGIGGNNLQIDWGDGSEPTSSTYHSYSLPGIYPIKVTGEITSMSLSRIITHVRQWGTNTTFKDLTFNIGGMMIDGGTITASDSPNFVGNISFNNVFANRMFGELNVNHWNTSNVTNMFGAFRNSNFNAIIGSWDTGNVTTMNSAFEYNAEFNQDISIWNTSNVTLMRNMFRGAAAFNQDISLWDVSNVTDMSIMFAGAESFNQSLNGWDVSNVEWFFAMFDNATSFNSSLSSWVTSSAIDFSAMFYEATAFNQPLNNFNTSNAQYMEEMFYGASSFLQDLSMWDVQNVTSSYSFATNSPLYDYPQYIPPFSTSWN